MDGRTLTRGTGVKSDYFHPFNDSTVPSKRVSRRHHLLGVVFLLHRVFRDIRILVYRSPCFSRHVKGKDLRIARKYHIIHVLVLDRLLYRQLVLIDPPERDV